MAVDHLMKQKTKDGYNVLLPITKPDNVKVVEPITVMLPSGVSVGNYKDGDEIKPNTSIQDVLAKMLQVQVPPTYTDPAIAISASGNSAGNYEAGTSITTTITSRFTQNDAGAIKAHTIFKNNTQVVTGTTTPTTYNETFTLEDTNVTFNSNCSYDAGAIKNDNFGAPYPTGAIAAGSKTSSNLVFRPFRRYFYGVDSVTTPVTSSDEVRALANKSSGAAANNATFNVSIPAGSRRLTIAFPKALGTLSKAEYVEASNDDYTSFLGEPATISVEGVNGYTGVDYYVYTWIPAQAWAANMTLKITI